MKPKHLAFLAALLPALAVGRVGGDWKKLTTGLWKIPFGNSVSKDFTFPKGLRTGELRVGYEGDYCSPVEVRFLEVTYDRGLRERIYANDEGIFELDAEETVFSVRVHNYQGTYTKVTCREALYYRDGEAVEEDDFEFLGTLRHQGGVTVQQVSAKIPERITHFWIEKPSYCSKLDVVRAGTITEGVFDRAKRIDKKRLVFEVNGGAGARISAIELELDGPKDLVCDVALYVRKK